MADPDLLQTLQQIPAPEAYCTGFGIDIAVLFELLSIHVVAHCKAAVKAERIVVFDYVAPEGGKCLVIPDL